MDYQIITEQTPNPNAFKFIINVDVISEGKASYKTLDTCGNNALAKAIFMLGEIEEVHFFENVLTVTKTDTHPWAIMEDAIKATILQNIGKHVPHFTQDGAAQKPALTGELLKIDEILERTIRPGLRMDGGDLTLLNLEGSVLHIHYEGACGSCPSAQSGTLQAIQNILQGEYHPDIEVIAI